MLTAKRQPDETWRECVIRYADAYGLREEALEVFDREIGEGYSEEKAAWDALYEWDLLTFESG